MSIQSGDLHKIYIEASSKADHFLLGAIVASCAYLAQSNPYAPLGFNSQALYLASLITLGLAGVFAHKRVEQMVQVLKYNATYIQALESKDKEAASENLKLATKYSNKTGRSRHARNVLMLLGALLYIGAKLWTAYQLKFPASVHWT